MRSFLYSSKLFFKNIFLSTCFYLFLAGVLVYSILETNPGRFTVVPLYYVNSTLMLSFFVFVFFLFLSYEFFRRAEAANMNEYLKSTRNGRPRLFGSQFVLLLLLAAMITILVLSFNLYIYIKSSIHQAEYLQQIFMNLIVNIFGVSLFGILMGGLGALLFKQVAAYLLMVVFVFLSTPVGEIFASRLEEFTSINGYAIYNFFNVFPSSLSFTANHHLGYPVFSYKVQLLAFWICLMLAFILLKFAVQKKLQYRLAAGVCAALCIISLTLYAQPASRFVMNYDPKNGVSADAWYYLKQPQMEENADFKITQYQLSLNPGRVLTTQAVITMDEPNLTEYKFTLYHGYQVSKITDQSDTPLPFSQEGDYITVKNSGANTVKQLKFAYSGSAPKFYAITQGMFLPGYFPYYPQSGFQKLFNVNSQGFERLYTASPVPFEVTVKSKRQVYCNLPEAKKNSFSGTSNGVTLMMGLLESCEAEGTTVVYPYLMNRVISPQSMQAQVQKQKKQGALSPTIKTIFLIPDMNFVSVYDQAVPFSDHIDVTSMNEIIKGYRTKIIPSPKLGVAYAVDDYHTKRQEFMDIASPGNTPDTQESLSNYYYLLLQKINTQGEKETLARVDQYLNDPKDNRTSLEFLKQL